MAFRSIVIESPAHLSLKNHQLLVRTDRTHSVPIEDISAILLESRQSTVTAAALSQLGQGGCALFICDEKHLPCAVLQPYAQHSRSLSVLRSQLEASEPLKKRLWQSIVQAKLCNQALCLRLNGDEAGSTALEALAGQVKSGDTGNLEAVGAQKYFPRLFGPGFVRGEETGWNAALNYGYAVLRGSLARHLAVYGFQTALGLHHRSTLNPFNLADDLMEPFRPLVDLLVVCTMEEDEDLTPDRKRLLFNCLNLEVRSGGQRHSAAYAGERLVQSLGRSLDQGKAALTLPEIMELKQHAYE